MTFFTILFLAVIGFLVYLYFHDKRLRKGAAKGLNNITEHLSAIHVANQIWESTTQKQANILSIEE